MATLPDVTVNSRNLLSTYTPTATYIEKNSSVQTKLTGVVSAINVVAGGSGYTSAPFVSLTGGGGSGAIAVSYISNGSVAQVLLTNKGSGYTSIPIVSISGGGGSGAILSASIQTQSTSISTSFSTSKQKPDYLASPLYSPLNRITDVITKFQVVLIGYDYAYRPDLIAWDAYGDVNLYWVVLKYNGIYNMLDPVNGLIRGRTIKVPFANDVQQWLQQVQASTQGSGQASFVTI